MFTMEIETGNAAFHDEDPELDNYALCMELIRNLREVTTQIGNGKTEGNIVNVNGNRCGKWEIK